MKRARFQADMTLDDDSEFLRRRPEAPSYQSRPPPPPRQGRIPGFFGLPTELKQHIYSLVLDSDHVERPSAPYLGEHNNKTGEIRYPTRYKAWRWPLAHWANRTLRNDLIDVAQERLTTRQVRAELDIMAKGFVFFPTWLHLPPDLPGDVPFDLDVSLRIFSGESFRSNDGWPRQPGAGFRILLKLLNQLVYEGPSFGQHFEILAGKATWTINALHINISFHDVYTPATHAETSHEIFRMLKGLANSGLAHGIIKTIHVHSEYDRPTPNAAKKIVWSRTYPVATRVKDTQAQQWRRTGFLNAHQRTLADDYRPPWDSSSGGPPQRGSKLLTRLERRDSPFGTVMLVAKNPQMDDYGLITPPTPRASAEVKRCSSVGSGIGTANKRLSTPTPLSELMDDYSLVMTPNMGGLLDDYSIAMTPAPGVKEDEGDC